MLEYRIDDIRSDYLALSDVCYLNTGTVGLMSEPVLTGHRGRIADYERYGHYREADARQGYEDARQAFADLIGASPSEIALTRNASDGINYVLSGLQHPDGATFITTDEEHPAVLLPLSLAADSVDGAIKYLSLAGPDDELLENLTTLLDEHPVSLAIISHISCETGRRLPIAEICQLCRSHGVLTFVDGAQSVGQIDVDVSEIGCDFMTGNGHKWLCGPKGTGFLYIRHDRVRDLTPPYAGVGSVEPRFDRTRFSDDTGQFGWDFRPDAQRFEFGTRNWHLYGAVSEAIAVQRDIGWGAIQRHVESLTDMLKAELAGRTGINVVTPDSWEKSCGIVTFTADGWDGVDLSNHLWNTHQIIQRRVQVPNGVRISCAHYTNTEDIAQFLTALDNTLDGYRTGT